MTEILSDLNVVKNNEPEPALYPYGINKETGKPSFYVGFYDWHKSDSVSGEPLKEYSIEGKKIIYGQTIDPKTNKPYENKFLYIYKKPEGDKNTICRKLAGFERIWDGRGNNKDVPEIELYKEAYQLYQTKLKGVTESNNQQKFDQLKADSAKKDAENEALRKQIEELQNKGKKSKVE